MTSGIVASPVTRLDEAVPCNLHRDHSQLVELPVLPSWTASTSISIVCLLASLSVDNGAPNGRKGKAQELIQQVKHEMTMQLVNTIIMLCSLLRVHFFSLASFPGRVGGGACSGFAWFYHHLLFLHDTCGFSKRHKTVCTLVFQLKVLQMFLAVEVGCLLYTSDAADE